MLVIAPGQRATVLVAFAIMGGTPRLTRAGKTRSMPPPAMELAMPARTARAETKASWEGARCVTEKGQGEKKRAIACL